MTRDHLWGCGDLDAVFHGHPKTIVPWPSAPRRKHQPRVPADVRANLDAPPVVEEVDPRLLHATQPWVVHHHAVYYLTGTWERGGLPSADRHQPANRWPLVTRHHTGRLVLLGGHHRALAALVAGRMLPARIAPAPPGPTLAVTPLLHVNPSRAGPQLFTGDPDRAAAAIVEGRLAAVPDLATAGQTLERLGLDHAQIADRLLMATTGRVAGGR